MEMPANCRRSHIRLASSDADGVITFTDDWISLLGHHTQIAVLQLEVNLLARARFEVNALKSAESDEGSAFRCRELQIKLYRLVPRASAGICHRDISFYWMSRPHRLLRNAEIAVFEACVAEPISKRIKRLSFKVPIGSPLHRVILKMGQLVDVLVKRNRQPARRIVFAAQRLSDSCAT